MSNSVKQKETHEAAKSLRNVRLAEKVYGKVLQPKIEKEFGFYSPAPSFESSSFNYKFAKSLHNIIPVRCFYTGVLDKPDCENSMWRVNRDHIVPIRNGINDSYKPSLDGLSNTRNAIIVLSSYVANKTLGIAPLAVKLKIRQWLEYTPYDRDDNSDAAGENMRWLLISMLNDFRVYGRFPWSHNPNGQYWYPGISIPFMEKMYKIEEDFLKMSKDEKYHYVKDFNWVF